MCGSLFGGEDATVNVRQIDVQHLDPSRVSAFCICVMALSLHPGQRVELDGLVLVRTPFLKRVPLVWVLPEVHCRPHKDQRQQDAQDGNATYEV